MTSLFYRLWRWLQFYSAAVTKYQLHSPFVYELADIVLEDKRWYYAFRDIERIRAEMSRSKVMLQVRDHGTGNDRKAPLKSLLHRASSSGCQGQRLFRLANWENPSTILELGTSVGISSMYLISGARASRLLSLEGSPQLADVARSNIEILGLQQQAEVVTGPFSKTLLPALQQLQAIDFVFFDGNHRAEATLEYFEECLGYSQEKTMFVFDDAHWSAEMETAWQRIQEHPRVSLTVDFFGLSLAFINPAFKQKQHFKVVPAHWKIWKLF